MEETAERLIRYLLYSSSTYYQLQRADKFRFTKAFALTRFPESRVYVTLNGFSTWNNVERQAVPLTKAKSEDHFRVWMYCVGCQTPEVNTESSNRGRSGLVMKEILVIAQN